jgi:FixJ family two-component response regulator
MVYLLDDEPGLLKALSRLLRTEGYEVQAFTTSGALLRTNLVNGPACLVLDVAMPVTDGLEVQEQLRQRGVQIPIVFLTGRGDIPMTVRAMRSGAVDFLTKPVNDTDLLKAVQAALQISQEQQHEMEMTAAMTQRYALLTPREREVMRHVVLGLLNKQIAAELGTGEQNIKIHRARVMQKMGAESVPDLVRAAERMMGRAG